jgi:hypothetical protein
VRKDAQAGGPTELVVTKTGYPLHELGLEESFGCPSGHPYTRKVDGVVTEYCRVEHGRSWIGELIADRGDGDAFVLHAERASRGDLASLVRWVEPWADNEAAPVVDPSSGYRTVGSVDGSLVVALRSFVLSNAALVPGPKAGLSLGWTRGRRGLTVIAVAGRSGDLRALAGVPLLSQMPWTATSIGGRPAYLLRDRIRDGTEWIYSGSATVVQSTEWGDLVVAKASGFGDNADVMARHLAEGVRQVSAADWARIVPGADEGPGLRPDPGRQEITRGTFNGEAWLLQTSGHPDAVDRGIDQCMKLSRQRRVCTNTVGGGVGFGFQVHHEAAGGSFSPYIVLSTTNEAAVAIVARSPDGDRRVQLVPLVGGSGSVAVVFGEVPDRGILDCARPRAPLRVDLLDEAGEVIGCLGT